MTALHDMTVAALAAHLRAKKVSPTEVAQHFLARSQADASGAFLSFNPEATLAQAKQAEAQLAAGTAGTLAGVPLAHKDIFVTTDFPTTAGSRMLKDYRSPFDATVVQKLGVQTGGAGMVNLGKLNCDEFAMGSSNENSAYKSVINPWDPSRVPGGSSGGSSAAVAARLVPAATGTDTGGSIRQPPVFAALRVSSPLMAVHRVRHDCLRVQLGPSRPYGAYRRRLRTHVVGDVWPRLRPRFHIARCACRKLCARFECIIEGLRIGIPKEFFGEGLASGVRTAVDAALKEYEKLGAKLVSISLPRTELSIPVYYIIAPAEASSNLSRFDGVKFGHRTKDYTDLVSMYKRSRAEGFGEEVKRRIMTGAYVLSHGYYDAYYLQAQKIRRMISDDFQQAFKVCDVIAGPVAPTVAWKFGEKTDDPVANYLADIFTLPASLAGLPGMSVPAGFGEAGMPVGLQLIGNYFKEAQLLNVAHLLQQATDFHLRQPEGAK